MKLRLKYIVTDVGRHGNVRGDVRHNGHIDATKADLGISRICALFGVSASGFYAWKRRDPSRRQLDDMVFWPISDHSLRHRTKPMAARACMWNCVRTGTPSGVIASPG